MSTKSTSSSIASSTRFSNARRVAAADLVDRRALVALEAAQRAVEVDVGGVEEFRHGKRLPQGVSGVARARATGGLKHICRLHRDPHPVFHRR